MKEKKTWTDSEVTKTLCFTTVIFVLISFCVGRCSVSDVAEVKIAVDTAIHSEGGDFGSSSRWRATGTMLYETRTVCNNVLMLYTPDEKRCYSTCVLLEEK
jgi:hypothetical protein